MLSTLRGPDGGPAPHVRLLAALVVIGMAVLTAPLVLVPLLRWLVAMVV